MDITLSIKNPESIILNKNSVANSIPCPFNPAQDTYTNIWSSYLSFFMEYTETAKGLFSKRKGKKKNRRFALSW